MKITLVCYKYGVPLNDPCCFPLGFMYVSSWYKQQGNEVKVLNYNLFDYNFVEEVKDQDLVCFTGFEEFKLSIIRDAKICKELGVKTILGGALATFTTIEMSKYVDEVFTGEFPETSNIDMVSYPDYDGFGVREYHKRNGVKTVGVLTTRGCMYHCTFCSQTCKFRVRQLWSVFNEIDSYVLKYGITDVVFNDNTFNINKERFLRVCKGMKERKLSWGASIRCDLFDKDMALAAKQSGCRYFVVGVESFNQAKLDKLNKHLNKDSIYKTLDLLHQYGIDYHGNILVGFEDESYQDVVNEITSIPSKYNVFPVLVQPFIGTKNGRRRGIDSKEVEFLSEVFRSYIYSKGKYQYPNLPEVVC